MSVEELAAHEAAVVRCSGCGAPRSATPDCVHCGSSFAAYERDLTSVCPRCVTRISDHARFCHGCGLAIAAEGKAGELGDLSCPVCSEQRMHSRKLGSDLSLLECSRCAGLWLGPETFEHVIRRAEAMTADVESHGAGGARPTIATQAVSYRPCPVCKSLMNRSQYGKYSRVIVDSCKRHGVWLDEGELSQILEWVRRGGLEQSRKAVHEVRVQALRNQQFGHAISQHGEALSTRGDTASLLWLFS